MITEFSKITGFSVAEILGESRKADLVTARHIYWLLMLKSGYSMTDIARLNNKGYATIHIALSRTNGLLDVRDFDAVDIFNKTKHLIQSSMSTFNNTITLIRPSLYDAEGKAHEEFILDHFDCPRCNGLGYIYVGSYNEVEDKDSTCPICRGAKKIKAIVNIEWSAVETKKAL